MKLKLDENIGTRGIVALRADGHDVATVHEQGLTSSPDEHVAQVCAHESRVLVSLDLGFANPLRFPPRRSAGIAVLRLPQKPSQREFDIAIDTLRERLQQADISGKLWIVEIGRVREYQDPDEPF